MDELILDTANYSEKYIKEYDEYLISELIKVFGALVISECVLAFLLVVVSVVATFTLKRWRRNFRNQLLMQLSIARLLDRIVNMYNFQYSSDAFTYDLLLTIHIYSYLVILILLIFFIKHMYESLIIVVVKVKKSDFYRMTCYSWLIPIPIAGLYAAVVVYNKLVACRTFYLIICFALRWPVMIVGTVLYLKMLYKVLTDKIRYYTKDLTIITFLVCFVINAYTISEDIKRLWSDDFFHVLLSAILGLVLDLLVACLYIILLLKARNNIAGPKSQNVNNVI